MQAGINKSPNGAENKFTMKHNNGNKVTKNDQSTQTEAFSYVQDIMETASLINRPTMKVPPLISNENGSTAMTLKRKLPLDKKTELYIQRSKMNERNSIRQNSQSRLRITNDESFITSIESSIKDESSKTSDESSITNDESYITIDESSKTSDESYITNDESFKSNDKSSKTNNESTKTNGERSTSKDGIEMHRPQNIPHVI